MPRKKMYTEEDYQAVQKALTGFMQENEKLRKELAHNLRLLKHSQHNAGFLFMILTDKHQVDINLGPKNA